MLLPPVRWPVQGGRCAAGVYACPDDGAFGDGDGQLHAATQLTKRHWDRPISASEPKPLGSSRSSDTRQTSVAATRHSERRAAQAQVEVCGQSSSEGRGGRTQRLLGTTARVCLALACVMTSPGLAINHAYHAVPTAPGDGACSLLLTDISTPYESTRHRSPRSQPSARLCCTGRSCCFVCYALTGHVVRYALQFARSEFMCTLSGDTIRVSLARLRA